MAHQYGKGRIQQDSVHAVLCCGFPTRLVLLPPWSLCCLCCTVPEQLVWVIMMT